MRPKNVSQPMMPTMTCGETPLDFAMRSMSARCMDQKAIPASTRSAVRKWLR
jgi:hypothetical protein